MKLTPLLLMTAMAASAQSNTRAVIRTTGQFDRDGSALYSVYVAAGPEDLGNLNIVVSLPAGSRFVESVHKPLGVVYEGVQHDAVFYSAPQLERDSLLGPFVFRVRSDGSGQEFPATLYGVLAYQTPTPEQVTTPEPGGKLVAFADKGTITVDRRGTLDAAGNSGPAIVGDTGAVLLIPEGALDREVKITVTRVPFEDLQLKSDEPIWWCATYEIRMEPQVAFLKPVKFALPTRRAVTPALELVTQSAASAPVKQEVRALGFGFGGFGGLSGCQTFPFGGLGCQLQPGFGFGGFGAFGYVEQDNVVSKRTSSQLVGLGTSSAAALLASPPSVGSLLLRP